MTDRASSTPTKLAGFTPILDVMVQELDTGKFRMTTTMTAAAVTAALEENNA